MTMKHPIAIPVNARPEMPGDQPRIPVKTYGHATKPRLVSVRSL